MGKYTTNSERLSLIEHQINGNGSIGMRDQLTALRKEVADLKKIIRIAIAIAIFFFGEKMYELLKHIM